VTDLVPRQPDATPVAYDTATLANLLAAINHSTTEPTT
jgi:hypothetical protein